MTIDEETNMTVLNRKRRKRLAKEERLCPICPLHGGENAPRLPRYSKQKPKYKNIKRERISDAKDES
jgi:hypothetical protein